MLDMFNMLNNAQNGQGIEALARQFGLSQEQTRQAIEALLPAFSQGLKQNASDPYGIGNFIQALSSGQHAKYFENPAAAFTPQGMAEGNGILGYLFGSKDLSRAVAGQAAQATGIGQDVLKQMLPALAAMIMGGMFKQSTGQMPGAQQSAQAGGFGNDPLGQIIEQMMRQPGGGQTQQPASPFDNPFGKALRDMMGGGMGAAPSPDRTSNPMGDTPWGKILEDMMGGGSRQPEPESAPRRETTPSGREKNPYDDIFGRMFETGRQQRDDYQKGVESIFDQFRQGMDRRR